MPNERISYPLAPRAEIVEVIHGTPVSDPFRPLEQAADASTVAWVDEENALTRRLLDGPERDRLVNRLRELYRCPRAFSPQIRGARLFFARNDGSADQASLCVGEPAGAGTGSAAVRVLVDPNAASGDGTTAITAFEADPEGARVVYALSERGSDRQELRVVDVGTGRDLSDRIQWVKFVSIAWTDTGFFYTRFPEPGSVSPEHAQYFCRAYFHRLGDSQDADRLVYERADSPEAVFELHVTSDGRHLVVTSRQGSSDNAEIHVADLAGGIESPLRPLVAGFADGWHVIDGRNGRLLFRTNAGAPLGRIVSFDLATAGTAPSIVVPESVDTIVDAAVSGEELLVHSLSGASSRLDLVALDGSNRRTIELPGIGTIISIAAGWTNERAFVAFTSHTTPPQILACDRASLRTGPAGFDNRQVIDPTEYETERIWYQSKDGTPVSMFLVSKKDRRAPLHGAEQKRDRFPVLLGGYGGFNISLTPTFDPSDFLWLDAGGTIAVAHLRGGGEYGEAWHQAGMQARKQNVFDDFIAAAEWLRDSGRASPGHIAIEGGSNGGLLVGAVTVQRPDLFGAVICRVPVADMLRYHLFTVGRFWIPEYGSADDPNEFAHLHRYSPYHNVVDGIAYPPVLIMTADTDDRVDPGMAKKFAARLQEAVTGTSGGPILLRVDTRAGHGAGKPVSKQIDEQADIYTFLFKNLKS